MQNVGPGHPSYEEPADLAAQREALHDAMGDAYDKHGNIDNDDWRQAQQNLLAFQNKHGALYNPD